MTELADVLKRLAAGQIPAEPPSDGECREELQQLIGFLSELSRFARAMAAGDLSATLRQGGPLAGALKGLHANLRHLTWQTQEVAAGDFTQRVDFLGDFSVAFNRMVESLAQARDNLTEKNRQLAAAYDELKAAQSQLLQKEKMASVGQLAAGVAHEINNPMGFIISNIGSLREYGEALKEYVLAADVVLAAGCSEADRAKMQALQDRLDISFILEDTPSLIKESLDGAGRVRTIVQNLKSFSNVDQAEVQQININDCLESTVSIAWNELKAKADVVRSYGDVPLIECRPQELGQVFLNILRNAAQAIKDRGTIRLTTGREDGVVVVAISDNGCGIPPEIVGRIFEPFFTTRPVGQGTGLGLSICYDIVKKHGGAIEVTSTVDSGTTFTIRLPIGGGGG
jgi:two-component system NtrC family sensor kinase